MIKKISNAKTKYLKKEYIYKKGLKELRHTFNHSEKITRNYSQLFQDLFVLTVLNGKKNGSYIEIGSSDPVRINNTFLLESTFDWIGLGYDINKNLVEKYNDVRKNSCLLRDATTTNFNEDFQKFNIPHEVDYLQIDIEPAEYSLECLNRIPFDNYRFKVITFETECYTEGNIYEIESRQLLRKKGYCHVYTRVGRLGKFQEDWYVHDSFYEKFVEIFEVTELNEIDPREIFYKNYSINKSKIFFGVLYSLIFNREDIYK